jgi:hypothetical protein
MDILGTPQFFLLAIAGFCLFVLMRWLGHWREEYVRGEGSGAAYILTALTLSLCSTAVAVPVIWFVLVYLAIQLLNPGAGGPRRRGWPSWRSPPWALRWLPW